MNKDRIADKHIRERHSKISLLNNIRNISRYRELVQVIEIDYHIENAVGNKKGKDSAYNTAKA